MTFWQIIKRELHQIFIEDSRRVTFLFGAGIAYLLLFGGLYYNSTVTHIPLVICDEAQSSLSRQLVRNLDYDERFKIVAEVTSEEEMQRLINEKVVYAAVDIPADLSKKVRTGSYATILCMVDGSNLVTTSASSIAMMDSIQDLSNKVAIENVSLKAGLSYEDAKKKVEPVECNLRVLGNPTQSYLQFFVLGLAMIAMQQGLFFSVGASIQKEYTLAKFKLLTKKINFDKLLVVKFLIYWVMSMLAFGVITLLARNIFYITNKGSLSSTLLLSGTFFFTAVSLGMCLSAIFSREIYFVRAALIYVVPAFILSGYTWPLESMDIYSGTLAKFSPFTYMGNSIRRLFFTGTLTDMWQTLSILACMGIFFLVVCRFMFRRRLRKWQ